jgi:uncharacterized membrane protein (DUF2068 family)
VPLSKQEQAERRRQMGLRAIAIFEAAKGLAAIAAGSGLFLLLHRDVEAIANDLVSHLHLNPAHHYPSVFLHAAANTSPESLRLVALGAMVYAVFRITEAVGLWRDRSWAEWLGVITGLIYVPFEARAFLDKPGPEPVVAFFLNLCIVVFLGQRLRARAARRAAALRDARNT